MTSKVQVKELPLCDICKSLGKEKQANYDARMHGRTAWAFMCENCYLVHGVMPLGTGRGQRLIKKDN